MHGDVSQQVCQNGAQKNNHELLNIISEYKYMKSIDQMQGHLLLPDMERMYSQLILSIRIN